MPVVCEKYDHESHDYEHNIYNNGSNIEVMFSVTDITSAQYKSFGANTVGKCLFGGYRLGAPKRIETLKQIRVRRPR